MTTFTPTHDVVTEATAAGFFPPRHNVEITQVTELTDRVMRVRSASAKSTATKSA